MTSLSWSRGAALATALVVLAAPATAQKNKNKPHRSVKWAQSWEAAVSEAKLLRVPIVVHDHGFY